MRLWLVVQEKHGEDDVFPDSLWTNEISAKDRAAELRGVSLEVDVYEMETDMPDGTVDPITGKPGAGWTG